MYNIHGISSSGDSRNINNTSNNVNRELPPSIDMHQRFSVSAGNLSDYFLFKHIELHFTAPLQPDNAIGPHLADWEVETVTIEQRTPFKWLVQIFGPSSGEDAFIWHHKRQMMLSLALLSRRQHHLLTGWSSAR